MREKYVNEIAAFKEQSGYEVGEGILLAFALFLYAQREKQTCECCKDRKDCGILWASAGHGYIPNRNEFSCCRFRG